jgi:hypothetical protein
MSAENSNHCKSKVFCRPDINAPAARSKNAAPVPSFYAGMSGHPKFYQKLKITREFKAAASAALVSPEHMKTNSLYFCLTSLSLDHITTEI